MKYIVKKLWPLILLLIISGVTVVMGKQGSFLWDLLNSYFFFAVYVIVIGILAHFFGEALPRHFNIEKGYFHSFPWEKNGLFYDKIFKVTKWKDLTFDASKAFSGMLSKNAGITRDPEKYMTVIQETCVAELIHLLLICLSPLMLLIVKGNIRYFLLSAYILLNLSDVIIQRYNRPRFVLIYKRLSRKRDI